jgi:hypothetical protein
MGTYNMQTVARELETGLGESIGNKKIVLTGSRLPLGLSDMGDASFNLGYALGKVGFLNPGVHVAVNGLVLPRDQDVISVMYTPEEVTRIRTQQRKKKKA